MRFRAARVRRDTHQFRRAPQVLRQRLATEIHQCEIIGRLGIAELGGRREQPGGFLAIDRSAAAGQPLLQEVYFLEKALDPYVSLTIGDRETVLTRNTAVLLIPDGAVPSATDRDEIAKWIERGGVAVRFAGPNLAAGGGDNLVPTPLRLGDRALGGVMSGTIGVQGHYANGLAALYLATGQDAACVAESAVGVTRMELRGDGLFVAVTLPNLVLGTVGDYRLQVSAGSLNAMTAALDAEYE